MQKGFVIILILALIIGIFAISNSSVVTIDFIFTEVLLSQAIVIFICVLLGALVASIFGGIRQMSLKKDIKELKNKNKSLQLEIYELTEKLASNEDDIDLSGFKDDDGIIIEPEIDDFTKL